MSKQLAKSTGLVGSMTFISRILGFIRDMVVAQYFGASAELDAFLVAFKLPNFFRALFAEGAFSQSFVPILAEYREKSTHQETQSYLNAVAGSLMLVLALFVLVGVLFAPEVIRIFAPGFEIGSERFVLASHMLRITFPYLFFISLTAFAGGILNTYGRFAVPAITPTLLNISLIACTLLLATRLPDPIFALAWGVLLGGILQLALQIPFLMREKLIPRPRLGFNNPGVRKLLKLIAPLTYGASITQINLMISTIFASYLVTGSVSWLYYADRLMQFPLGIFGVALATVTLPYLSRKHAAQDSHSYGMILDWAIKVSLLIALPAAIALWLLSTPILTALFQYREFTAHDVAQSAAALNMYTIGLVAFILQKLFAVSCYAKQDMKGPVIIATFTLIFNLILSYVLMQTMAHVGLALATSASALIGAALLFIRLIRHHQVELENDWLLYIVRIVIANASMGAVLYGINLWVGDWGALTLSSRALFLLLSISSGIVTYALMLLLLGFRPRQLLKPIAI